MALVDLTTVAKVKSWVSAYGEGVVSTDDDANIQLAITDASIMFLSRVGRGPRVISDSSYNPFSQEVSFTEMYSGNGRQRIMLRQFPIVEVQSVTIDGFTMPESTTSGQRGWYLGTDLRSLYIRHAAFTRGVANITVTYTAGFSPLTVTNEIQYIPSTPGSWSSQSQIGMSNIILDSNGNIQSASKSGTTGASAPQWQSGIGETTIDNRVEWVCLGNESQYYKLTAKNTPVVTDLQISFFSNGEVLTPTTTAPYASDYIILSPGSYLFSSEDAGKAVVIAYKYAGTPSDIISAVTQLAALILSRRKHVDQRSIKDGSNTTVSFYDWEFPPSMQSVIDKYKYRGMSC